MQAVSGYTSDENRNFLSNGDELVGKGKFEFHLKNQNFGDGNYFVSVSLFEFNKIIGDHALLVAIDRAVSFRIKRRKPLPFQYILELDTELIDITARQKS